VAAGTPDPPAGTIERLADGRPAGVLKETAAGLVTRLLPAPAKAQREAAITHMVDRLHAEGMTGFKDPNISKSDWEAYLDLAGQGRLKADVCVLFQTPPNLSGARETLATIRAARAALAAAPGAGLRICGAKIFMDGSGAAPTAWMYQDWSRERSGTALGNHGYPQVDPEVFRAEVDLFVAAGEGAGVHAIGDRAIDWTVDAFASALAAHPQTGLRLSIIHANTPTDHAIAVMADLQKRYDSGIPESQGGFAWWLGDIYAANLGPERSLRLNPFRTYERNGVIWAGGSDSPVTPIEARYGLWASRVRETAKGVFGATPFGTAEGASAEAALKSYTIWAARQIRADQVAGSLEVGKEASLAVWDLNPLTAAPAALKDMVCELTLWRGEVVYDRSARSGGA
jgi:predicted amidohydrolase YtcJ